ncbi:hypothetical protein DXV75_16915 [Alteromonas aestuariivivens]|uniref:Uncharacterized protein n=1 Tax=Alteromonas aestuariivivens TaxID=1938339 RepID=A0A3D8M2Y1_9ALTE|nr:hypothetical protein [Alteromonas aestuariivivens]RDV23884.1 hypothetical protein DXV75_16915 [Alteromonas aestuariivivens]
MMMSFRLFKKHPIFEAFYDFAKYFRTRKAIKSGVDVLKIYSEDTSGKYLGPWKMNALENFIASFPSFIVLSYYDFLYEKGDWAENSVETSKLMKIYENILLSASIPFILLLACFLAGIGTLKFRDWKKAKISAAQLNYLYVNSSYGLFPQCLLVFGFTLLSIHTDYFLKVEGAGEELLLALFLLVVGVVWNSKIIFWNIPTLIFERNGYTQGSYPWSMFILVFIVIGYLCLNVLWWLFIDDPLIDHWVQDEANK